MCNIVMSSLRSFTDDVASVRVNSSIAFDVLLFGDPLGWHLVFGDEVVSITVCADRRWGLRIKGPSTRWPTRIIWSGMCVRGEAPSISGYKVVLLCFSF